MARKAMKKQKKGNIKNGNVTHMVTLNQNRQLRIFPNCLFLLMVPKRGLEPPRLAALDPKSSVSTSSTTSAYLYKDFDKKELPTSALMNSP